MLLKFEKYYNYPVVILESKCLLYSVRQIGRPKYLQKYMIGVVLMANYYYSSVTATNGVKLHYIKTSPNNITFEKIDGNINETDSYGINGGFFNSSDRSQLYSIAVINHEPINGEPGGYYSGWQNAEYDRGTLIWDPVARKYTVARINTASEIDSNELVTDLDNYWAQGGVSMSLGDDDNWEEIAEEENINNSNTYRTGMVFAQGSSLWLIVSEGACTPATFREAIKEKVGSGTLTDGIFLDGSTCSQFKCKEKTIVRSRMIAQKIVLINN